MTQDWLNDPQRIGDWLCAVAFLLVAGLTAFSHLRLTSRILMALACVATAAWAISETAPWAGLLGMAWVSGLELLRDSAWIAFLLFMPTVWPLTGRLIAGLGPGLLLLGAGGLLALTCLALAIGGAAWSVYPQLLLSILALVLVENLYRTCGVDGRQGLKRLCFGLGLMFGFALVTRVDALFAGRPDAVLIEAGGFIGLLAAPLLLLSLRRSDSWRVEISLSRDVAFHSALLLASGAYLLVLAILDAAMSFILPQVGHSATLQLVFIIATLMSLLMVLSSGAFRAHIRVGIAKHFFSHSYDYRALWLKFIRDLAPAQQGGDLQLRVLHAVADIFDCPAGALWVRRSDGSDTADGGDAAFIATARWNFGDSLAAEPAGAAWMLWLTNNRRIIDLAEYRTHPQRYPGLQLPAWLRDHPHAWLLSPLIHHNHLQAFLVLDMPRSAVNIAWEGLDLLATVSAQAASYLAEEQALRHLVESHRLEEFNRWSGFLVHDIKGIVGQMSLLVANAEHHAHDHAFQRDVVATVANAVLRMRQLLDQLNARTLPAPAISSDVDMAALLRQVGERWRRSIPSLRVAADDAVVLVQGHEAALVSVLDHLIENAVEACGPRGQVTLALRHRGADGILEVQDDGPGMDPGFVSQSLFKPLVSAKPQGTGLGAFQVRQLVRSMGGRVEVDSAPGVGTTMRVLLPIAPERRPDGGSRERA